MVVVLICHQLHGSFDNANPNPAERQLRSMVQILDIPKTLEYLETQGVAVAGYGCDEFPAFFTRSSGCRAHCRIDSCKECVPPGPCLQVSMQSWFFALHLAACCVQLPATPSPSRMDMTGSARCKIFSLLLQVQDYLTCSMHNQKAHVAHAG